MNDLERQYSAIESAFPTLKELLTVEEAESGEAIAGIKENESIRVFYDNCVEQIPIIGRIILVRQTVANKITRVANNIKVANSNLSLSILFGYRLLEIQTQFHNQALDIMRKRYPDTDEDTLIEHAQTLASSPLVGGHPTGAAVDVTLFDETQGKFADMGASALWDQIPAEGKKIYTFSPEISQEALALRMFLRNEMIKEGFNPFDGEFWHFSYGDREWAFKQSLATNQKVKAIYSALSLDRLQSLRIL